jgi:hypothetical protein
MPVAKKSPTPDPFRHRAGQADVVCREPTFIRRPTAKPEELDTNPRTAGRVAATKADVRRSAARPRIENGRPEADDLWVVLTTARGIAGNEIEMSRRCFDFLLLIAGKFGFPCDATTLLVPHNATQLQLALERCPVLPKSDADQAALGALIDLLSKGNGLRVVRTFNRRDSRKSVRG